MSGSMSELKEQDFASSLAEARSQSERARCELEKLAAEINSENSFSATFAHLMLSPAGVANELTHGAVPIKLEMLGFHLLPFLGSPGAERIDAYHISRALDALDSLFVASQRANMFAKLHHTRTSDPGARELDDLAWSVRLDAETVRGSAYPVQIAKEINETLGRFDDWFEARVGISPTRATSALLAIVSAHEAQATSWIPELLENAKSMQERFAAARKNRKKRLTDEDRVFLQMFRRGSHAGSYGYSTHLAELAADLPTTPASIQMKPPITRQEWEALLGLIGCTPAVRGKMTEPIEMIRRPLLVLSRGRVLCGAISPALDQLRAALEEIAAQDLKFVERYRTWRGEWHQGEVVRCLKRLFPPDAVYESLTYPDPDKPPGHTAELDAAVFWEPFLILVEAKSGQFRLESQLGDIGRLRSDLKNNIADAFDQVRRAARYVESHDEVRFVEKKTGRELVIRKPTSSEPTS